MEHMREYNKVSGNLEVWLQDKEAELQECGPIGANHGERRHSGRECLLGGVWFEWL